MTNEYLIVENKLYLEDEELNLSQIIFFLNTSVPKNPEDGQVLENGCMVRVCKEPSGELREAYLEKSGKMNGQCLLYHEEGYIQGEMYYQEDQLHGPSIFYSSDGKVLARSYFVEDNNFKRPFIFGNFFNFK